VRLGDAVECPVQPDPCLRAVCQPATGECVTEVAPDGGGCDDGRVCTIGDRCVSGVCRGEDAPCDDNNPCSSEECMEEQGGCVYAWMPGCCASDAECEDFDECTIGHCSGGACTWEPIPGCGGCTSAQECDDGRPCTVDTCNTASGDCAHQQANVGAACEPLGSNGAAVGLCDAVGECTPFARQVWGEAGDGEWGGGISALWQPASGGTMWAAGWRNAGPRQEFPGYPLIFLIEGERLVEVAYTSDEVGPFTDMAAAVAVGPGGTAMLSGRAWERVRFDGLQGIPRRLAGYRSADGDLGGWYIVDEIGLVWACLGDFTIPIGLPITCLEQDAPGPFGDSGPIVGTLTLSGGLPARVTANVWYLATDG